MIKYIKILFASIVILCFIPSIVNCQIYELATENNYVVIKQDGITIDFLWKGGSIIDYKFISKDEVIVISDIGVSNEYGHFKYNGKGWDFIMLELLGQTPQQRLKYSSALPKDYWEIKDKIVTFKIADDYYKVEVLENGKKINELNVKQMSIDRLKYIENVKMLQDSLKTK